MSPRGTIRACRNSGNQGRQLSETVGEDVGAGERRFLLLVSAGAGWPVSRALRRLLAVPPLAGRARAAIVGSPFDAVRALQSGRDEIAVAVGGDGTANLVARALRESASSPLMGILPLGTGNALAHTLGIGSTESALAALHEGSARPHDVMTTSHPRVPLALASLSCGFDGRFLMRYARLRRFGRGLAAALALPAAMVPRRGGIRLAADGTELVSPADTVFSAGLYNLSRFAGGRLVCRGADPGDGRAEAVVCPTLRCYLRTVRYGFAVDQPDTRGERLCVRWRHAVLETAGPVQFDGEWAAIRSCEVRLEAGGVRILVPPGRL